MKYSIAAIALLGLASAEQLHNNAVVKADPVAEPATADAKPDA